MKKTAYGIWSLCFYKTGVSEEDAASVLVTWSPVPQRLCSASLWQWPESSPHGSLREANRTRPVPVVGAEESHHSSLDKQTLPWNLSTRIMRVSPKPKKRDLVTAAADQQQEGKPTVDGQVNLI